MEYARTTGRRDRFGAGGKLLERYFPIIAGKNSKDIRMNLPNACTRVGLHFLHLTFRDGNRTNQEVWFDIQSGFGTWEFGKLDRA